MYAIRSYYVLSSLIKVQALMEDFKIKEEIWIEKYRPVRLNQVAGQDETIERLMSYVATKNLPHP